jgi:polyhydroxybutyrate depolymerase
MRLPGFSIRRFVGFGASTLSATLLAASVAGADVLTETIVSAGAERSYLLYVPDSYRGEPVPLVLSLHGSGGRPEPWVDGSGLTSIADREGFAVAFPAGAFTNTVTQRSWNANLDPGVDDVQFVRDLIADASMRIRIDPARVYATGFSGGARMSSRLACELADVLAAAAPVAGVQYPDGCTPVRMIPLLAIHSKADPVNQYELSGESRPYWRMGVETAIQRWLAEEGCGQSPAISAEADNIELRHWAGCDDSAEIRFYVIADGGHDWPDWGPETIWAFFEAHSL